MVLKCLNTVEELKSYLIHPDSIETSLDHDQSSTRIERVAVYKVSHIIPVHFLVLRTVDKKWWSLLKSKDSIILKRCHDKNDVVFYDENHFPIPKYKVNLISSDRSKKTIFDIIRMLEMDIRLFHGYDILNNNCWMFAKFFYDKCAMVKTFDHSNRKSKVRDLVERALAQPFTWATNVTWKGFVFYDFCNQSPSDILWSGQEIKSHLKILGSQSLLTQTTNSLRKTEQCFLYNFECSTPITTQINLDSVKEIFEDAPINWVAVYKTPLDNAAWNSKSVNMVRNSLHGKQLTKVDYHAFIALKTCCGSDEVYWSFEKQQDGIYIQRGISGVHDVIKKFGPIPRAGPIKQLQKTSETSCTLHILLNILHREYDFYSATENSCQHFSKRLYDKISAYDAWEFVRPREYISVRITAFSCFITIVLFACLVNSQHGINNILNYNL